MTPLLNPLAAARVLVVGYRTRLVEGWEAFLAPPAAPSTWKDEEKIREYVASRRAQQAQEALLSPYTATFDSLFAVDVARRLVDRWDYRPPESGRASVCAAFRRWLLSRPGDAQAPAGPFVVLGFGTRNFLKILGLECSLPGQGPPLPPALWYGNADHRDIAEAVAPKEYGLDFAAVLRARGVAAKEGWAPHQDPQEDVRVTTELAVQLGLLGPAAAAPPATPPPPAP